MMAHSKVAVLALLASTTRFAAATPIAAAAPLDVDDECSASSVDCAMNAIQMRGAKLSEVPTSEEPTDAEDDADMEGGYFFDAPAGWIEEDEKALAKIETAKAGTEAMGHHNYHGKQDGHHHGHQKGKHHYVAKEQKPDHETYCSKEGSKQGNNNCFLYKVCHNRKYCVMWGYLVMPGAPLAGTEEIDSHNAAKFDFLFNVAGSHCGGSSCVLIVNPSGHRTQEQLHIHFRHYNGNGATMKSNLEKSVCSSDDWVPFSVGYCSGGQAKRYSHMPRVFSEVVKSRGGSNLGGVGIQVWPSSCGHGVIVQTTIACSIEHDISAR